MNVVVQLRMCGEPVNAACAWWIPEPDPGRLVLHLATGLVSQADLAICATSDGALVIPTTRDASQVAARPDLGLPLGCVAGRLYLPVDAELFPPLSAQEINALLPDPEGVYFWHPRKGVVRWSRDEVSNIDDLVSFPRASRALAGEDHWNAAVTGEQTPLKLLAILAEQPLDMAQIFGSALAEVGANAGEWVELPPARDETAWTPAFQVATNPAFKRIFRISLLVLLLAAVYWASPPEWRPRFLAIYYVLLLVIGVILIALQSPREGEWLRTRWRRLASVFQGLLPRRSPSPRSSNSSLTTSSSTSAAASPGSPSMWSSVGRWLGGRYRALSRELEAARHREVLRLLDLLEHRPDEGLRFAPPLNDDTLPRGVADSHGGLTSQQVDFSLNRLSRGGEPVDVWRVSPEYHGRLMMKYRELVNREINLGRHRRAAYILAQLLGDLRAAAKTLDDGGFHREAAALHEQRLNDPAQAGECLVRGGFISDAITIFDKLKQHEKVAELYERLGQWEEAALAYRRSISAWLAAGDMLKCASIFENKLKLPDEAYRVLLSGWPYSGQAERCWRESFQLLGRLGRHAIARKNIEDALVDHGASTHAMAVARVLGEVAENYPESSCRHLAADGLRRLASRRLSGATKVEQQEFMELLANLDKTDRLLRRDCQRFGRLRTGQSPPPPAKPLEEVRKIYLPHADWSTLISLGNAFYAAGYRGDELVVTRGDWEFASPQWPHPRSWPVPAGNSSRILLAGSDKPGLPLNVLCQGCETPSFHGEFVEANRLRRRRVESLFDASRHVTHYHVDEQGIAHLVHLTPDAIIVERSRVGGASLLSVWTRPWPEWTLGAEQPPQPSENSPLWLIAHQRLFCAAWDRLAAWALRSNDSPPDIHAFDKAITGLAASRDDGPPRMAVSLESGCQILAINDPEASPFAVANHLARPVACFSDSGHLFAADERFIECFEPLPAGGVRFVGSLPRQGVAAVAMCRLSHNRQIATLDANNAITVYEAAPRKV